MTTNLISQTDVDPKFYALESRIDKLNNLFSKFCSLQSFPFTDSNNSKVDEKLNFIESVGTKMNELLVKLNSRRDVNDIEEGFGSVLSGIEDSVSIVERQLNISEQAENDGGDLRSRILRIGRCQESTQKAIQQQINDLLAAENMPLETMKELLRNVSENMENQMAISMEDQDLNSEISDLTNVAFDPESSENRLRDSLKKILEIHQKSQTKVAQLQKRVQNLEDRIRVEMDAAPEQHGNEDNSALAEEDAADYKSANSSTTLGSQKRDFRSTVSGNTGTRQSANRLSKAPPTKSSSSVNYKRKVFDIDNDAEIDSFALREAYQPEMEERYKDQLNQIQKNMRAAGLSDHEISKFIAGVTDQFIDLKSQILVQQDQIKDLKKENEEIQKLKDEIATKDSKIKELENNDKESLIVKKLKNTNQVLMVKLTQAKNKIVVNHDQIRKLQEEITKKNKAIKALKSDLDNTTEELNIIHGSFDAALFENSNLASKKEVQKRGLKELVSRLHNAEKKVKQQQQQMVAMKNMINKLRQKENDRNTDSIEVDKEHSSIIARENDDNSQIEENVVIAEGADDNADSTKTQPLMIEKSQAVGPSDVFERLNKELYAAKGHCESLEKIVSNLKQAAVSKDEENLNSEIGNLKSAINDMKSAIEKTSEISDQGQRTLTQLSPRSSLTPANEEGSEFNEAQPPSEELTNTNQPPPEELTNTTQPSPEELTNTTQPPLEELTNELNELRDKFALQEKELNDLKIENENLQKAHDLSIEQLSEINKLKKALNGVQEELDSRIKESQAEKDKLEALIKQSNDKIRAHEADKQEMRDIAMEQSTKIINLENLLEISNNTISTLNKEKESLMQIMYNESNNISIPEVSDSKHENTEGFQLSLEMIENCLKGTIDNVKSTINNFKGENTEIINDEF